jgi:hypothetical protein
MRQKSQTRQTSAAKEIKDIGAHIFNPVSVPSQQASRIISAPLDCMGQLSNKRELAFALKPSRISQPKRVYSVPPMRPAFTFWSAQAQKVR